MGLRVEVLPGDFEGHFVPGSTTRTTTPSCNRQWRTSAFS